MKKIESQKLFLDELSKAKTKTKLIKLLKKANEEQIYAVVEVLLNYERFDACSKDKKCIKRLKSKIGKILSGIDKASFKTIKSKIIKYSAIVPIIVGYSLQKIVEAALSQLFSEDG